MKSIFLLLMLVITSNALAGELEKKRLVCVFGDAITNTQDNMVFPLLDPVDENGQGVTENFEGKFSAQSYDGKEQIITVKIEQSAWYYQNEVVSRMITLTADSLSTRFRVSGFNMAIGQYQIKGELKEDGTQDLLGNYMITCSVRNL